MACIILHNMFMQQYKMGVVVDTKKLNETLEIRKCESLDES